MTTATMTARERLTAFANKHKIVLEDHGECGFARPCVGLRHGDQYISYHPRTSGDYQPVEGFPESDDLSAPAGVRAYHKHDCLAVLVEDDDYETGLAQLDAWIRDIESRGEVEIASFPTGATGIQAMLSGIIGRAIRYKRTE